jgi:hypothetical protein
MCLGVKVWLFGFDLDHYWDDQANAFLIIFPRLLCYLYLLILSLSIKCQQSTISIK